jgi:ribonuclease E
LPSEEPFSPAHTETLAGRVEPAAEGEPEAAAGRRARQRAGASEPRLERIVVGGAEDGDTARAAAPEAAAAPTRKGWWQRRLSGE